MLYGTSKISFFLPWFVRPWCCAIWLSLKAARSSATIVISILSTVISKKWYYFMIDYLLYFIPQCVNINTSEKINQFKLDCNFDRHVVCYIACFAYYGKNGVLPTILASLKWSVSKFFRFWFPSLDEKPSRKTRESVQAGLQRRCVCWKGGRVVSTEGVKVSGCKVCIVFCEKHQRP